MASETPEGGGIKSDETLFDLVEHIRAADGAGVTELASATGRAKSTVHGHLSTMRDRGFVVKRDGEYHLGLEFFNYGHHVRARRAVYDAALAVLRDVADDTGETAWLMAHENGRVIYLDGRSEGLDINVNSLIGSWKYMHSNSGGKAILAHLPEEEVDEILARHGLPAQTEATVTDRERLDEELAEARERGYALNFGEDLSGIHAVAVPLVLEGSVVGSLAVAGPAHRLPRERCEGELADRLSAAANDVQLSLTYR